MATSRYVLCDSLLWCKVIACLSMVGRILMGLILSVHAASLFDYPVKYLVSVGTLWFWGVIIATQFLLIVIGVGSAFLLLKGANERNVYYLRVWIFFASLSFVCDIFAMFFLPLGKFLAIWILYSLFNGIAILTVFFAKSEIDASVSV